jgi:hypothetical protein
MTTQRVMSAPKPGVRWFVRVSAVIVGLANLAALPLWFGNPFTLRDDTNFAEAITPLLIAVIAGLTSSEVCLRRFDLPGRSFIHRYWIVVVSVCLGGALMGAPLAVQFTIDGTLAADPPPGSLSGPIPLLVAVVETLPYGLIGAAFGVVIGLMEGLVLALPLAAALGMLHDD